MHGKVTEYIRKKDKWTQELNLLRSVLMLLSLDETIKWGAPVYVHNGKNIVGLSAFKDYCGLWFFQGSFLLDDDKLLENAQEGKTKAMRQWRFYKLGEIDVDLVKTYVLEAIKNSEDGKELRPQRKTTLIEIPEELQAEFEKSEQLKHSFNLFTDSKKREFVNHIAEAKRATTKQKRIEKIIPMILQGLSLYNKYKNCS